MGPDVFREGPALTGRRFVGGIGEAAVCVEEGAVVVVLEEVEACGGLGLVRQRFAVCGGVGGLFPEREVSVHRGGGDVPVEVAAGPVLRALDADGDAVHGVVEEQDGEMEAGCQRPLEAGDIEALVAFGLLQVTAHGHGDGHAGSDEDLKLQHVDADACADLQAQTRGDRQAVEDGLAGGADDGLEVGGCDRLILLRGQTDVDDLVIGLVENLLRTAVAGEHTGGQRLAGAGLVVEDLHVDLALQIQVEAPGGIGAHRLPGFRIDGLIPHIQGEDQLLALAQALQAALLEARDLRAFLGVTQDGEADLELHLDADLQIDVDQRAEGEAVLDRELEAQRTGQARVLEVVAVVDGVVLEHDRDLDLEGDLDLLGGGVAVFGVVQALVFKETVEELFHGALLRAGQSLAELLERGHAAVGVLEALLRLFAPGRFLTRSFVNGVLKDQLFVFLVVRPVFLVVKLNRALCGGLAVLVRRLCDGNDLLCAGCVRFGWNGGGRLGFDAVFFLDVFLDGIAVAVFFDGSLAAVRFVLGLLTAGVVGVLVLIDGDADGEADLVAVHDDGDIVAQLQLQRGQLRAQIGSKLRGPDVAARAGTAGLTGVTAALHIQQLLRTGRGGHVAYGNGFGLDVVGGVDPRFGPGAPGGLDLLLYADGKGGTAGEGTQVGVDLVSARFGIGIAAVVLHLGRLTRDGDGAAGDVVVVHDGGGVVERHQQAAGVFGLPGKVGNGVGVDDLGLVIIQRVDRFGIVALFAHVAAQRNVDIGHRRGGCAIHRMVIGMIRQNVAIAPLLVRKLRGGAGVGDRGEEGRQKLGLSVGIRAHGDRKCPGPHGQPDPEIILVDDPVLVLVGLEERVGIVALHQGYELVVFADPSDSVCVIVDHHVIDVDLHGADCIQILGVVEEERHRILGQIRLRDGDRIIARVGAAVVQDHVLGVLLEVDGLEVLQVCQGINAVLACEAGGCRRYACIVVKIIGQSVCRDRLENAVGVFTERSGVDHGIPLHEIGPHRVILRRIDGAVCLFPGRRGVDIHFEGLRPLQNDIELVGIGQRALLHPVPEHLNVPYSAVIGVSGHDADLGPGLIGHKQAVVRNGIADDVRGVNAELGAHVEVAGPGDAAGAFHDGDFRHDAEIQVIARNCRIGAGLVVIVGGIGNDLDPVARIVAVGGIVGRLELPAAEAPGQHVHLGPGPVAAGLIPVAAVGPLLTHSEVRLKGRGLAPWQLDFLYGLPSSPGVVSPIRAVV